MNYTDFLKRKKQSKILAGFTPESVNDRLFPFQGKIVKTALEAGRYAIFADCGLGKTFMQLEWAYRVNQETGKPVLILCPLAVAGQTIEEGKRFGIPVFKVSDDELPISCIEIANYEQIENIDPSKYAGVVLDESSILKNYEGSYRNLIIEGFAKTPYKLACTATPSPNDPMELGNHSEFLGYMTRTEMLAMFFVHDGGETAKWRLKGHAINKFYDYVASWSVMLNKPSDIGFNDSGYNLPELNYMEKQITTEQRQGSLFNNVAVSATNFNSELRLTMEPRIKMAADIVNNSTESFIVWVKQNEEGEMARKLIPGSIEVKGSDSPEYKEKMLLGFGRGEFRVLITKSKIAQFGLNYQNCHNQVFPSLDFSFEGLYQSIRRSYRFGQKNAVNIWLITTDTMTNVLTSIKRKQAQFDDMKTQMIKLYKHDN